MDKLITKFPAQLLEGLKIGEAATIHPHNKEIHHVVVIGMGGSGIGGDFIREFIKLESKVPVIVSKGYTAPAFIGENSLVLVSSYSGNTEETLQAYNQIKDKGAKIVCITSGGKLLDIAKKNNLDTVTVPSGWPSPRACLGFSIVSQLAVLTRLGIIAENNLKSIYTSCDVIKYNMDDIQVQAEKIARQLYQRIPIIYTTDRMESVAVRLRQQINENAKGLAWSGVIPEMNHNELVGWRSQSDKFAVIFFRSKDELAQNKVRIDITKKIISEYCDTIIDIFAKGKSMIEQALYLVHIGDWISYYLSQLNKMDSIEVKAIDYLKSELAKI